MSVPVSVSAHRQRPVSVSANRQRYQPPSRPNHIYMLIRPHTMFARATSFNGDILKWDVSKVTTMTSPLPNGHFGPLCRICPSGMCTASRTWTPCSKTRVPSSRRYAARRGPIHKHRKIKCSPETCPTRYRRWPVVRSIDIIFVFTFHFHVFLCVLSHPHTPQHPHQSLHTTTESFTLSTC